MRTSKTTCDKCGVVVPGNKSECCASEASFGGYDLCSDCIGLFRVWLSALRRPGHDLDALCDVNQAIKQARAALIEADKRLNDVCSWETL